MKNKKIIVPLLDMTFAVRSSLLTSALVFIIVGLWKQEHLEVMGKAVKVCLECIGIG